MSRWVEPTRAGFAARDEPAEASGLAERIVKYIPAEVLVGYTALITGLGSFGVFGEQRSWLAAGLMALFFVVTLVQVTKGAPKEGSVRRAHLLVSPIAFLAWSYPISACLLGSWFEPALGFVLLALAVALSIVIRPRVVAPGG